LWNGAAYSAVGAGGTGIVLAIEVDGANNYYIGGSFLNWAGVGAADYAAWWDGSAWAGLSSTALFTAAVRALAIDERNILYLGGTFTDAGGIAEADRICSWNGTSLSALGSGLDGGPCFTLALDGRNNLLAGGTFLIAGGLGLTNRMAKWNGASWAHFDVNLPGAGSVPAIGVGYGDPVIAQNQDIYVGFSNTGTAALAGLVTITNSGTTEIYPVIVVERSGGTEAIFKTVRNETTGNELLFNYSLLDGERLTIDLRPAQRSIISSMFGSRPDAILANSDMVSFTLQPGDNDITSFVDVTGAPTITAWIEWRTAYKSLGD